RQAYAFALASCAAAVEIDGGVVKAARFALGGVGTKPWRVPQAEAMLTGQRADKAAFAKAAARALEGAQPRKHNAFKVELAKRAGNGALVVRGHAEAAPHTVRREDDLQNALPHELMGGGRKIPADGTRGDVAKGLREGAQTVEQTYETPPETHNPMEPHATIAVWTAPDKLTVYDSTQWVFSVQRKLAKAFALPKENVRVIAK